MSLILFFSYRLYGLARVSALASSAARQDTRLPATERNKLAEQHAPGAVALLNRARAAGYFKNPNGSNP